MRNVTLNLPTAQQPRSAVYSSACYKHCTSTLAFGAYWGVRVDGISLSEALAEWFSVQGHLPAGISNQLIESCNGFGCGLASGFHRNARGLSAD